jgi:hypothetical protein
MKNFRPAKCCYNCRHRNNYNCKFDIPEKSIPGMPQGITMRAAVCNLFDWQKAEIPADLQTREYPKGGE